MKQILKTVESSSPKDYDERVNELLRAGYMVKSVSIGKREVGTYDEFSVFQAILVRDIEA